MAASPLSQRADNNDLPARPRLVLHAGTTKTGSTSLQVFLHQYRQALIDHGILYPDVGIEPHSIQPKHQWIVQSLLSEGDAGFLANQNMILEELSSHPHAHTVVLSTEGLYNHWWDFSDAAKSRLRKLEQFFDVTVWVIFREPLSFAKSLYGQMVKNPKNHHISCYGTADPLEMVLDDPSFSRNLRYADFVRSVEALFDRPIVLATKYEDADIIDQAKGLLGLHQVIGPAPGNVNVSLGEIGLGLIRRINKLMLDPAERKRYIDMVREIDALIGEEDNEQQIPNRVKSRVYTIAKESMAYLKTRYQIHWD